MDHVILPSFDHGGFRVRWNHEQQLYDLCSAPTGRLLSTSRMLFTAEHVVAELESWGFWCGTSPVFEELYAMDETVSAAVGDPFVVGDPSTGTVGLATPNGRSVEPLPAPRRGFAWADRSGASVWNTSVALLRASAPVTVTAAPGVDLRASVDSCITWFTEVVLPGRPNLGFNVRAIQHWALAATDETAPFGPPDPATMLANVGRVDDKPLQRAVTELQATARLGAPVADRPRLRVVRSVDSGPSVSR